jgi:hypothetical protein
MTSLYNITNEFRALFDKMVEQEDWESADLAAIDALSYSFDEKAIAVAAYIKELESHADAIQNAIKEMTVRMARTSNKVLSLRDYLRGAMFVCDKQKISSPYFDIKRQKNPPSVEVIDGNLLDAKYFNIKETQTIDKARIKEDLKAGIEVAGARLVTDSERLVIK